MEMLSAGLPQAVAERRVFAQDTEAMRTANLGIAVLDGAVIDDGVAFEVGYLFALGTPCLGLQTDVRRASPTGNNPMISQAPAEIAGDKSSLLGAVRILMAATGGGRCAVA